MGSRLSGFAGAVIEQLVGLFIDDGLVVAGAVGALVVTGILSQATEIPSLWLGILLFVLVALSLIASLLRAARDAHRHAVDAPSGDPA